MPPVSELRSLTAMGHLMALTILGWLFSLGLCSASIPPGCQSPPTLLWDPASSMDTLQLLLLFTASLGWLMDVSAAPKILMSPPFYLAYLLSLLLFAGLFTPRGLAPSSPSFSPAACTSPACIVCLTLLLLLAIFVLAVQTTSAYRTLSPLDFLVFIFTRATVFVFYTMTLALVGNTDAYSSLTFSPWLFAYIGASFCLQSLPRTPLSVLTTALALAAFAQGFAQNPSPFAPLVNCRVASSLPTQIVINDTIYSVASTNITNPLAILRAQICLVTSSGMPLRISPPDLNLCAQMFSEFVCSVWPYN